MPIKSNKLQLDLLFITLLILIQILLVVFRITTFLRAGVGFLFIAFIPGYVLLALLMDSGRVIYISIRRLILAVPVSLAVTVLIGLAGLLFTPKSINNVVQVLVIGIFDFIIIGLAFFRRRKAILRGIINLMVFMSTLFLLVTLFVVIYPTFK